MNSEAQEFLSGVLRETELLIENLQSYFSQNKISDENSIIFLNILSDLLIKDYQLEKILKSLKQMISDESNFNLLEKIIKDNLQTIKSINTEIEINKFDSPRLIDIEWKFIGSANLDQAENEIFEPRILLNLVFSNGDKKIIETNFAGFKKLQEEFEIASQSFNSAYSRKLKVFTK